MVVLPALLYALGGFAHGYVVRGKRHWEAFPHVDQWREVLALAKDGAGFARSALLSPRSKVARSDIRAPLRSTDRAGTEDGEKGGKRKQHTSHTGADKKSKKQSSPKRGKDAAATATAGTAGASQLADPDLAPVCPGGGLLVERREGAVHTSQQRVQVVSLLSESDTS